MEKMITKDFVKNLKKPSNISGIYKIISPSGKIYIGQSIDLYRRLKSYFEPNSNKNQKILRYSFNKYGVEKHKFYIIEECDVSLLNERERYWQEKYINNLLNCRLTETSDKSGICLEQTKINISNALKKSGKSYQHLKRKIYQYDDKGDFIKEWESVTLAAKETNTSKASIIRCCKGRQRTANDFIWSY